MLYMWLYPQVGEPLRLSILGLWIIANSVGNINTAESLQKNRKQFVSSRKKYPPLGPGSLDYTSIYCSEHRKINFSSIRIWYLGFDLADFLNSQLCATHEIIILGYFFMSKRKLNLFSCFYWTEKLFWWNILEEGLRRFKLGNIEMEEGGGDK